MVECNCGENVGLGQHDCRYVVRRNKLISEAAALADLKFKATDMIEEPSRVDGNLIKISLWTREFSRQMNNLVRERLWD